MLRHNYIYILKIVLSVIGKCQHKLMHTKSIIIQLSLNFKYSGKIGRVVWVISAALVHAQ